MMICVKRSKDHTCSHEKSESTTQADSLFVFQALPLDTRRSRRHIVGRTGRDRTGFRNAAIRTRKRVDRERPLTDEPLYVRFE